MKNYSSTVLVFFSLILTFHQSICSQVKNELFVANWNVENLFDTLDDTTKADEEFLPGGEKDWSYVKLQRKVMNLANVLKFMNDGKGPDVFGLEEVENIMVCKYIAYEFENRDYLICHRQSPDERGIDNALFYDRNLLKIVDLQPIPVVLEDGSPTRDILYVALQYIATGDTLYFYVNHWPSRRGGEAESEKKRISAAEALAKSIIGLKEKIHNPEIIVIGDFNDEPDNTSISESLNAVSINSSRPENTNQLINLACPLFERGDGTYLYKNNWNMLDQIIISKSLYDKKRIDYIENSFEIVKPDFMITNEGKFTGSPIPTYAGKKYLGGYSDHFPVAAKFAFIDK